ncbi:MAG: VWA domain-containing protein [Pseudomonadota bacterium]
MRGLRLLAPLLGVFCWLVSPGIFGKSVSADKADVRVLIDISGSMKQNDPKNLRRPALRLLVGLLPKDTRAGVWTFGQYVNMQIPLGQVDKAWKYRARESSKTISSPGQFTNIEDALKRATEDWSGAPGKFRRSVILLTDGMVDISKSKAKNQASRQRILQTILPHLQQLGVAIHTIALSKNADHELMQELAKSTGGWYEQVENAGQLQKVFLRIFEKVSKPDAVPLKDNKFTIDNSITEATVLVFHKPNAQETQLIPPGGQSFSANNAPSSVSWHRDEGYDMLTISDPEAGEWRIRAEVDPDNRVMVVTDLKMQTTDLPNRLIVGQSLPLEVSFTDHGRHIRKKSFLRVVSIAAAQHAQDSESEPRPLLDDGAGGDDQADDGIFSMGFGGGNLQQGMGELVISARSNTFVREKRMTYEVVPPVELVVKPGESNGTLMVSLIPDERLVKVATIEARAWMEDREGKKYPLEMSQKEDAASQGTIDIQSFSGTRKIFVEATGMTLNGESLDYLDSPVEVEGIKPPAEIAAPAEPEPVPEPEPVSEIDSMAEADPPVEQETPSETVAEESGKEDDWLTTSIWIGVANLLLLLIAGGAFWWIRKSNQKSLVNLVDETPPASPMIEEEKAA